MRVSEDGWYFWDPRDEPRFKGLGFRVQQSIVSSKRLTLVVGCCGTMVEGRGFRLLGLRVADRNECKALCSRLLSEGCKGDRAGGGVGVGLLIDTTQKDSGMTLICFRWIPHPVMVAIGDNKDSIRVLLDSYYTTITGWGVLLKAPAEPWVRCASLAGPG